MSDADRTTVRQRLMSSTVGQVLGNRSVRWVQVAYAGSIIGDAAWATAILVWLYAAGGAGLAGAWLGTRMLLKSVAGPLGAVIADRVPRRTFMVVNDAIRLVLAVLVVVGVMVDSGLWPVIPAAMLSIVGASYPAALGALLPEIVTTPGELTGAIAVSELLSSAAKFVGPAIAGGLIGLFGVGPAFAVNAASFVWSLAFVARVRVPPKRPSRPGGSASDQPPSSAVDEVIAGVRMVGRNADLRVLAVMLLINGVHGGLLGVMIVELAEASFHNAAATGFQFAVIGVTNVISGLIMVAVTDRVRLARTFLIGVLGWCVAILAMGIAPVALVVVAALILIGLCESVINVPYGTIPQRIVDDAVRSRVLAALEAVFSLGAALGAFVTPVLFVRLGLGPTAVAMGAVGAVVTLLCLRRTRSLDTRLHAPRGLDLLTRLPLFAPLDPSLREALAHALVPVRMPAGKVVVREGDVSDTFYIIERGEVVVTVDGRELRREEDGDFFGEIGLLLDVPRTASVTAVTDVELLTLSREEFLAAMSGDPGLRGRTHDVATVRLAG